jgi:tetratricopeptide (TPR) repeat protein
LNLDHQLSLADALSGDGDVQGAIALLNQTISQHPDSAVAQFNLATLHARERQFTEAVDGFRKVLSLDSNDDTARLSLAKALIGLDRQADALAPLNDLLKRKPSQFEALYLRGLAYRGLAQYEKAIADLTAAVRQKPDDYECQYNLGFTLAKLNRLTEARQHLEKALSIDPDSQEAMFQLAGVLRKLGQTELAAKELRDFQNRKKQQQMVDVASTTANKANQALEEGHPAAAIENYRAALKLDPNNAKTYFNLALAQIRLNQMDEAISSLEKALVLDPHFSAAANQLGMLLATKGRFEEAGSRLTGAIKNDPQCAECQTNLAVLYGMKGETQRAETLLRQVIENNPKYGEAHLNLALILAARSKTDEARTEFNTVLAAEPGNVKALRGLGMLQTRAKDPAAADTFRRVVDLEPRSADAHVNLGIALADLGKQDAALNEFSEAVRLAPNLAITHYNKGRMLTDLHRTEEARAELKIACESSPTLPDACLRFGMAEHESGQAQTAISAFQKTLSLDPRNSRAYFELGNSFQSAGRTKEAIDAWKKCLEFDPSNTQATYALLRALNKTSPEEAKLYRDRMQQLQTQHDSLDRAQSLSNFAIAAAKQQKWDEAIGGLRQAIQTCGTCQAGPMLHKNLGLIECQAGRVDDGEKELLAAQRHLPDDPDIQRALEIVAETRKKRSP